MKYRLRLCLRDRSSMFWGLCFPLLLSTLFYFTIMQGGKDTSVLEPVKIAFVSCEVGSDGQADRNSVDDSNGQADENLQAGSDGQADEDLQAGSDGQTDSGFSDFIHGLDGDTLQVTDMSKKKADHALRTGKVTGIFTDGDPCSLKIAGNDIEENVLKSLLNAYNRNADTVSTIKKEQAEKMAAAGGVGGSAVEGSSLAAGGSAVDSSSQTVANSVIDDSSLAAGSSATDSSSLADDRSHSYTHTVTLGGHSMDGNMQYFFALIAMTCLYGCFLGLNAALESRANLSPLGLRRSVTPTHKLKLVLSDMLVTFFMQTLNLLVLLLFLTRILGLDLGGSFGEILFVCAIGSMFGVSLGILTGSAGNWSEGVKIAILVSTCLILSFLAGLMVGDMKDIIEQHIPILNRINPAAVIADALYCLVIYEAPDRLHTDLILLGCMTAGFILLSFFAVRREHYDSL